MIRVDTQQGNFNMFNVVFSIERTCKHSNIQGRFNFDTGTALFECDGCGEPIITRELPNEQEAPKQEAKVVSGSTL